MDIVVFNFVVIMSMFLNTADSAITARQYLSNLSKDCLHCICHATSGCDLSSPYECSPNGRCGPFRLSQTQWVDAGRPAPETRSNRPGVGTSFSDCAGDFHCAELVVIKYMELHGQDCNGDLVTDCDDYLLINAHGSTPCHNRLNRTTEGREYLQRYDDCRPS